MTTTTATPNRTPESFANGPTSTTCRTSMTRCTSPTSASSTRSRMADGSARTSRSSPRTIEERKRERGELGLLLLRRVRLCASQQRGGKHGGPHPSLGRGVLAMSRLRPSGYGETCAQDQRLQAVIDCGFTERQARFLVLVMRHAGVCVPRQYASFAGIANGGRRCNAFFDKLVRRRLRTSNPVSPQSRAGLSRPSQAAVLRSSAKRRAGTAGRCRRASPSSA